MHKFINKFSKTSVGIGIIIGMFLAILLNFYFADSISANSLDLLIKTLAIVAPIVSIIVLYEKWQDEKRRDVYLQRLKEVYVPLTCLLFRQELYRKFIDNADNSKEKEPLLVDKYIDIEDTPDGIENVIIEGRFLKAKEFLTACNESDFVLARPQLIKLITEYKLMLELERERSYDVYEYVDPDFAKNLPYDCPAKYEKNSFVTELYAHIEKRRTLEKFLIEEIEEGYLATLKVLDLDPVPPDLFTSK